MLWGFLNPTTPQSDEDLISPCSNTTESIMKELSKLKKLTIEIQILLPNALKNIKGAVWRNYI